MKKENVGSIKITYPFPNGCPVAVIKLVRDIEVKNEPMMPLQIDNVYSAKNLPAQNKKDILVRLESGGDKFQSMKVVVEPSYSFNGAFFQYISGVKVDYYAHKNNRERDERLESITSEFTRALTGVHKLATKKDLDDLKTLVKDALVRLDNAKVKNNV